MMEIENPFGTLYLIPTTLGENPPLEVLPFSVKTKVEELNHFIVENEKVARRFIKKLAPNKSQENLHLYPLNKFTTQEEIASYLNPCLAGIQMGLMSDAGTRGGVVAVAGLIPSHPHFTPWFKARLRMPWIRRTVPGASGRRPAPPDVSSRR